MHCSVMNIAFTPKAVFCDNILIKPLNKCNNNKIVRISIYVMNLFIYILFTLKQYSKMDDQNEWHSYLPKSESKGNMWLFLLILPCTGGISSLRCISYFRIRLMFYMAPNDGSHNWVGFAHLEYMLPIVLGHLGPLLMKTQNVMWCL